MAELEAPRCTMCGKVATARDIDGDWWPPCTHARTHGIETLRYADEAATPSISLPTGRGDDA